MKEVELSKARAMFKEILAIQSATQESIGTVLKLGHGRIDSKQLRGFGELEAPIEAVAEASQSAQNDIILVDDAVWEKLETIYREQVIARLFF